MMNSSSHSSIGSSGIEAATLTLPLAAGQAQIRFLKPGLVRVRWTPDEFSARRSWAVTPPDESFPGAGVLLYENGALTGLSGELLAVIADLDSGCLRFEDAQGRTFFADLAAPSVDAQGVVCLKQTPAGECIYGLGQRGSTLLERGGRLHTQWATDPVDEHTAITDPFYLAVPVLLALRPGGPSYGVFFNTTWRNSLDLSEPGQMTFRAANAELDYYLIYGPTPAEVLNGLAGLLGGMPMPPRWALGYQQSRWSYTPQDEVLRVARELRQRGLPCDALHLDIDYMDGYRVFTWNPRTFADPPALGQSLHELGFHLVTIIDPGVKVDAQYAVYSEGAARGFYVQDAAGEPASGFVWPDQAVFPDFLRADVRAWWGNLQKGLVEAGVDGVWNDMNEPAVFSEPFSQGGGTVGTLPLDARQGPANEPAAHAEVHNLYGYGMAQASYEGMRRLLNGRRPFILTRSGYAGSQRWSAAWMGDNGARWEHLQMSLPQLMNMGLSGMPFVGVDIGGFFGAPSPELFARWMQASLLYPFCRNHACAGTPPQEPWAFGPQVEEISRTYLNLRYRMLPYLYTLFHQAAALGEPILRPLFYQYPDDPATFHISDQAMLGPFVLAAPVMQPGRTARAVYLPAGDWYDYWTDTRLEGHRYILADAPLERMPLYLRAGAIVPLGPQMLYTGEKPLNPLTLEIYPGQGSFGLYEDDGETYEYIGGAASLTDYRTQLINERLLVVECSQREGLYTPAPRHTILRVHRGPGRQPLEQVFEDDGSPQRFEFILD
jgi:alpha-glucosidase